MIEIDDSNNFCGNWVSSKGVSRFAWPASFRAETILTSGIQKWLTKPTESFLYSVGMPSLCWLRSLMVTDPLCVIVFKTFVDYQFGCVGTATQQRNPMTKTFRFSKQFLRLTFLRELVNKNTDFVFENTYL